MPPRWRRYDVQLITGHYTRLGWDYDRDDRIDAMSRIGRKIIALPAGVTVLTEGPSLAVKGPKGTLRIPLPQGIHIEKQDGHLLLKRELP